MSSPVTAIVPGTIGAATQVASDKSRSSAASAGSSTAAGAQWQKVSSSASVATNASGGSRSRVSSWSAQLLADNDLTMKWNASASRWEILKYFPLMVAVTTVMHCTNAASVFATLLPILMFNEDRTDLTVADINAHCDGGHVRTGMVQDRLSIPSTAIFNITNFVCISVFTIALLHFFDVASNAEAGRRKWLTIAILVQTIVLSACATLSGEVPIAFGGVASFGIHSVLLLVYYVSMLWKINPHLSWIVVVGVYVSLLFAALAAIALAVAVKTTATKFLDDGSQVKAACSCFFVLAIAKLLTEVVNSCIVVCREIPVLTAMPFSFLLRTGTLANYRVALAITSSADSVGTFVVLNIATAVWEVVTHTCASKFTMKSMTLWLQACEDPGNKHILYRLVRLWYGDETDIVSVKGKIARYLELKAMEVLINVISEHVSIGIMLSIHMSCYLAPLYVGHKVVPTIAWVFSSFAISYVIEWTGDIAALMATVSIIPISPMRVLWMPDVPKELQAWLWTGVIGCGGLVSSYAIPFRQMCIECAFFDAALCKAPGFAD